MGNLRFHNLTTEQKGEVCSLMKILNKKHRFPKSSSIDTSTSHTCNECALKKYGEFFERNGTPCIYILNYIRETSQVQAVRDLDIGSCQDLRGEMVDYLQYFEYKGKARGLVRI